MKQFRKFAVCLLLGTILLTSSKPAVAQAMQKIEPDIIKYNDYYRFTFKSDIYTPFDMLVDGDYIIIDFEQANDLDLNKYIYDGSIIKSFGTSDDAKSVAIKVNANSVKTRKFIADNNTVGFDLFVDGKAADRKFILMSEIPKDENASIVSPVKIPEPSWKPDKQIVTFPKEYIGPPSKNQLYKVSKNFIGPQQYDSKGYEVYEIIRNMGDGLSSPTIQISDNGFILSFPLDDIDTVSTAALEQGDKITLIFNTVNKIKLGDVIDNPYIRAIREIENDKYKIIEITLNQDRVNDRLYQKAFYKDKFSWILEVFMQEEEDQRFEVTPINVMAEDNFGEKRILANANDIVGPININFPDRGLSYKAFLIKDNASGIVIPREFVDLKFVQSLQGIFIEEKSDYLSYENTGKRIAITKLSNLQISDEVISSNLSAAQKAQLAYSKVKGIFLEKSIFPFPVEVVEKKKKKKKAMEQAKELIEEENHEEKPAQENKEEKKDKHGEVNIWEYLFSIDARAETEESEEGKLEPSERTEKTETEKKVEERNSSADPLSEEEDEDADLDETDSITEEIIESGPRSDITNKVLEYTNKILSAPADKKLDLKFDLAKFYFENSLYAESLGELEDIRKNDPGYEHIFLVNAMLGASQYFTQKYDEAFDTFSNLLPEADKNQSFNEILLWQWASKTMYNIKKRNSDENPTDIDFIASFDKFMQQYPENLQYEMGLMYIKQKLDAGKVADAKNVLDIISYLGVPRKYINDTKFYKAFIAEKEGDTEKADKIYNQLIKKLDDRKNRARAMVELTKGQLIKNKITAPEAIDKFMLATTIWRDDYFEMDVLEMVGHLYVSLKDYTKALETWKNLANNFPETTESVFILGKMKQLFIDLFDGGIAYQLKPLETLKLYFGFRELTPVGELGDRITRKVAQFFITADMMDEAAKIVEHQIKYRTTGDERGRLALWLSEIKIDNRDLDGAERALDYIQADQVNPELMNQKKYAQANIMALRGKYDETLAMLKDDFSKGANRIRTELFWQKENWFGVIRTIEERLPDIRETRPRPLTKNELQDVIRLSVAYAAQENNIKLAEMKLLFGNRINSKSDVILFDYLTQGSKRIDYKNFEQTVELENIERFLNDYDYAPDQDWVNVIEILEPKVEMLKGSTVEELTNQDRIDVIQLAIAYIMKKPADEKEAAVLKKKSGDLARDFKDIKVDRFTIEAFNIFDDKFMPKETDAIFEGRIRLADIPDFINYYKRANKFSELNMSIRERFKN